MVGNHRTIYNESLIYQSLKLNPLGFCILFIAPPPKIKKHRLVLFIFALSSKINEIVELRTLKY